MPLTEMDEAWRRDYAFKNRARDMRVQLAAFMNDEPKLWPTTHEDIQSVIRRLVEQEDHIVAVWD
jgi:hypothetical protein